MTQNKNYQGISDRTRYLLAAVLVCSALLLGVVAPVKAEPVFPDVFGVGCNYVGSGLWGPNPSLHRFDLGVASGSPSVIADTKIVSNPIDVAITSDGTPDSRLAIVSSAEGVFVFNLKTNTVLVDGFGSGAAQIAVSPDGTKAVIGSDTSNTVTVLSISGGAVTTSTRTFADTPSHVSAVGITPDSQYLFVGAYDGYLHILDLRSMDGICKISLGNCRPGWMTVDPSGKSVVITSYNSDEVFVLGMNLENLLGTLPESAVSPRGNVGVIDPGEPDITADGRYAIVPSTTASGTVSVIDLSTSTPMVVGNPITVGSSPQGVAIVDDYDVALVTNRVSSTISVIDIASLVRVGTIGPSDATTSINRFAVWRPNRAPTANAGPDQNVAFHPDGTSIQLDGSGSSDPDRDYYLKYAWAVTTPNGESISLSGDAPTFLAGQAGTYAVKLIVADPLGLTSTDEMTVIATPSNTPPTLDPIGDRGIDEGQTLSFQVTASDMETPDGLLFSAADLPTGSSFEGGTFSWTTVDGDAGEYTVTFTVTDGSGGYDEETVTITVNDVVSDMASPEITVFAVDSNPAPINKPVTIRATIDDSKTGSSAIESAMYSLDDGIPVSMTPEDGAFDESTETVVATLTGLPAGVHRLTLSAADAEGNVATISEPLIIVVYDPSAGFVTGGGWIKSPVDTAYPYQTLTGKATFGFVAKYQKGKTVPKGEAEFTFKTGGMTFHSGSYTWLLVTQTPEGHSMAELQGTGTLNGKRGYGMTLTAVDNGRADTLRFRITDSTKKVVYDTGDAMLSLKGGSIVIHRK